MTELNVNAEYLRLAALFSSTDPTRYNLHGVNIEPHPDGGALMVASDGHRLGIFYDRIGEAERSINLRLDKPTKSFLKKATTAVLQDDRLVLKDVTGEIFIQPGDFEIDGRFPNWRGILPKPAPACPVFSLNLELLPAFAEVAKKMGPAMSIHASPEGGPIQFRVRDADFLGLWMPMQGPLHWHPDGDVELPGWISVNEAIEDAT
ncbi:hypothetical protein [Paremcibacter congregatus]|uniref:hypothetical protein n=1 Tax=Paremcibacter congregatus TaxID=2043170 RepID=UPI0030EC29B9